MAIRAMCKYFTLLTLLVIKITGCQKIEHNCLVIVLGNGTWLAKMVSFSAKHGNDGNCGWAGRLAVTEMGAWL